MFLKINYWPLFCNSGFHFFTEMDRQMDLMNMPNQNNAEVFDFIISNNFHTYILINHENIKFSSSLLSSHGVYFSSL